MSKIVISGYYGFGNGGDEAMLAAILEAILEIIPEAEITVISGNPKRTAEKHGVKAIPRLDMGKIFGAIRRCDLLISGGGSLLQDVTSDRSLYYYLSIIRIATLLSRPVMLYAQGIGPLRRHMAQRAVGKVLNSVDLITVRDETSRQELERLGVTRPPVSVTADAVLSMHPVDVTIGRRLLKDFPLSGVRPRIGVSVRAWKNEIQYRAELAAALDQLQEEFQADIIFIPMQHPDDTAEAHEVRRLMHGNAYILEQVYTTTELLALTGCMDLLVGVRLHALVFASLMGKPVVGISYDPKISNFLQMIGQEAVGTLTELDRSAIITRSRQFLTDRSSNDRTLALIQDLRESSLRNAHIALELLEEKHKKR